MAFQAVALNVLIASPGDISEARETVEIAIRCWNSDRAYESKVVLLPVRWDTSAISELGDEPQAIINRQLVDDADIVVGLFDSRLGTPTARYISGTAEEIERSHLRGVKVHVHFSSMPIPRNVDPDQLKALNDFRDRMQSRGLLKSYASLGELSSQIRSLLDHDVRNLVTAERFISSTDKGVMPMAVLRASYQYDLPAAAAAPDKAVCRRTARTRIEVENVGRDVADKVSLKVEALGGGNPPIRQFEDFPDVSIAPLSRANFPVYLSAGTAPEWLVQISWEECGIAFSETQTLRPF